MTSHATHQPIISLRGVYKSFGSLHVLRGVDLDFEQGKTTVVLGPSGTGKSVMLKIIVCLLRPDEGSVSFHGRRIDHLSESELAEIRMKFGFLFQLSALFDSMNVQQNICFPMVEHLSLTAAQRQERCSSVLKMVGLDGTQTQMPANLSGGQKKRIALARAIALNPDVILYDEPTTGLDPIRADLINELILKLQRQMNVTSIVVTHDMHSAFRVADRLVMLNEGRIIADGTPDEIRQSKDPAVLNFVLGKADEADLAAINSSSNLVTEQAP